MSQERLWEEFFSRQNVTLTQQDQFKEYYRRLVTTNELQNITAITDLKNVITDHFEDSLALRDIVSCDTLSGLGDIGTGAGFPALPLKIIYPALPLVLIEVNSKKRSFIKQLCDEFNFSHVILEEYDWRTFLRQTDYVADLFCARASLRPDELVRIFKPSSPYKNSQLVYWASEKWQPTDTVLPYVSDTYHYTVGSKVRKLVRFKAQSI